MADALEQAGADTDALRQVAVEKEVPAAEDMTTQVVVAGGGMGGLMAAVTAAHEGADVILLEKLPFVGGSLFLAGGGLATADSEVVGGMGADDDLQRIVDYFKMVHETSEREPDYEFVEYLLGQTGPTIDFMANELGMEPTFSDRGDYIRTNFGDGRQEVESLKKQPKVPNEQDGTLNGTLEENILLAIRENPDTTQSQIASRLECSESEADSPQADREGWIIPND